MSNPEIAIDGTETARNKHLPLPIVKYPKHYGAFFGFKQSEHADTLYFCACAEQAINNCLQSEIEYLEQSSQTVSIDRLIQSHFPKETAQQLSKTKPESTEGLLDAFPYRNEICHRCNNVTPKFNYCHEMYGTVFAQNYGWYINQAKLHYGFPGKTLRLSILNSEIIDLLPDEYVELIDEDVRDDIDEISTRFVELDQKRRSREKTLNRLKYEAERKLREDRRSDDFTTEDYIERSEGIKRRYGHDTVLTKRERVELDRLRETLSENKERVIEAIENEVRLAFGHYEKGNRWTSETVLYQIIEEEYGDQYTIERHHRPDWLDGLELDIYLSEASVGIEYQGEQHYNAVEHWGGEEALRERQERDQQKRELCDEHEVQLVEIRYDESLSAEHITERLEAELTDELT